MQAADIDLGSEMVRAGPAQARKLGDITADAFRDDPFNRWLFGNIAGVEHLFRLQAQRIYAPRGFCYTLGDEGACMWMMPGGNGSFSLADYLAFTIPTLFKSGPGAVVRGVKTGQAMDKVHPAFAHAYLFSVGVRPRAQGKGLGRRLIQPVLDACDRKGVRAYLENSNPANTGFYASLGFVPCGEIRPTENAPPLLPMVREPRSA